MNRTMLMFAIIATVTAVGACNKKDFNAITGTTDYASVSLTTDPTSFNLHVHLVPDSIFFDSTAGHPDTIPAHEVPVDSTLLTATAFIQPQDVAVANGTTNMTFTVGNSVASFNDPYIVPDTTGTTSLTIVYTDVNHSFTTTTAVLPITVTQVP